MNTIDSPPGGNFAYSLFGIQQTEQDPPSTKTKLLIESFDKLVQDGTDRYVERVVEDGIVHPRKGKTHVWIITWKSVSAFESWWDSPAVSSFWESLPSDAGMWREILKIPFSRSQYKASQNWRKGLGAIYPHKPTDKVGYWGWIRDAIRDLTKQNRMDSPLPATMRNQSGGGVDSDNSPTVDGHVLMTVFPDNICFNLERQDMSGVVGDEKEAWFENFDGPVRQWMIDLSNAGPETGVLSSRMCYDKDSGTYTTGMPEYHNYNVKVEPFYFVDLKAMEKLGRSNKGHVSLRNNILKMYGPGGSLFGVGRMALWVETSILKGKDIEAEYIGCVEGTGLMPFRDHEAFK